MSRVVSSRADDRLEFDGSLTELLQTVKRRVDRASQLLAATDDPAVIDREIRYIRPFWEMYQARRRFNHSRFWERKEATLFDGISPPHFVKTALIWLPRREALCQVMAASGNAHQGEILTLLRGIDIVLFQLFVLLGRLRFTLGIESEDAFRIVTRERRGGQYQLMQRRLVNESADGSAYRILTCRFALPDGEEIKIEKDYSEGAADPLVSIRFDLTRGSERQWQLQYDGRQSDLKRQSGRLSARLD